MLEYAKVILPKVSFNRGLFEKELKKCINWVNSHELIELKEWAYKTFGKEYPEILARLFNNVNALV